jgi:DNA mismatch repair protein MutS
LENCLRFEDRPEGSRSGAADRIRGPRFVSPANADIIAPLGRADARGDGELTASRKADDRRRASPASRRLTPARLQWEDAKAAHPDCIVLFRMGDFYETFGDDAKVAAEVLRITLTKRAFSPGDEPFPMAGVPVHAFEGYAARLVKAGYRVAVCEQLEDPKEAKGPVVRRGVVRILSPGTLVEDRFLQDRGANYLACLVPPPKGGPRGGYALGLLDVSTAEFLVQSPPDWSSVESALASSIPSEVLAPPELHDRLKVAAKSLGLLFSVRAPAELEDDEAEGLLRSQFKVSSSESLGLSRPEDRRAAACLLRYARESLMSDVEHVRSLKVTGPGDRLVLDATTLRNLEIFRNLRDGTTEGTLVGVLDSCPTPMGSRLLGSWLRDPLAEPARVAERLDAVQSLVEHPSARLETRDILRGGRDLDRLLARLGVLSATPRDLLALRDALDRAPRLADLLGPLAGREGLLNSAIADLRVDTDLSASIARTLDETQEDRVIREGCDPEIDELRGIVRDSRDWIARREEEERRRTGIKSLRISYNQVFGYFIEVTKANLEKVPSHYVRKQTTANGERFVTSDLEEAEERIATAEERLQKRERELFEALRSRLRGALPSLVPLAAGIATVDALASFARAAADNGYVRPAVDREDRIDVRGGRHPVIERLAPRFVPNDCRLDGDEQRLIILTGPNMGGKSTYMRQVALIQIMAQAGSFVPADRAELGVVDRVLTRVGATDDIARGHSTFMVEMVEIASILRSATSRSLVLLDEIGRGTSTYDGMAIAWAVAEALHDKRRCGAKTILSTHYHQLTQVTESLKGARNLHTAVKETGEDIVFLHRVVPGSTDRSYGIHVARLAGLPDGVVDRATEVLRSAEAQDAIEIGKEGAVERRRTRVHTQLMFLPSAKAEEPPSESLVWLREALLALDTENMTPLEAMSALDTLRKRLAAASSRTDPAR